MQEEQVENPDYTPAEAEAADGVSTDDAERPAEGTAPDEAAADAPPDPPTGGGTDEEVLKAPEVPDDSNEKISAAQQHLNKLNMDEQRNAAQQAQKKI